MNKSTNPVWTPDESGAVINAFAVIRSENPTKPMSKVTLEAQKVLPKKRRMSITGIYAFNSAYKDPLNEALQTVKPGASIKALSGTFEATSTNPSEVSATQTTSAVEAVIPAETILARQRRGTTLWKPVTVTKLLKQAVLIAKSSEADTKLPMITLIAMAQVQVLDADLHRTTKAISAWMYANKPAIVEEFKNLSWAYDKREAKKAAEVRVEEHKAIKEVIAIPGPRIGTEFFDMLSKFGKEFDALVAAKKAEFDTHAEIKGEQVFHSKIRELDAFMASGADKMMDSIPVFVKRTADEYLLNAGVAKAESKLKLVTPIETPKASKKPQVLVLGGGIRDIQAVNSAVGNMVEVHGIENSKLYNYEFKALTSVLDKANLIVVFPCKMDREMFGLLDTYPEVMYLKTKSFSDVIPAAYELANPSKSTFKAA